MDHPLSRFSLADSQSLDSRHPDPEHGEGEASPHFLLAQNDTILVDSVQKTSTKSRLLDRATLRIWLQLSAVCLLLIFSVGAANNASRYNTLGHQMMCTCGCAQVLLSCNHVGCTVSTQEEAELRNALDRGDNNNLILQNFVQKYGPTVLAAPPEKGFDLVAWIAPGLVFLLATLGTALLIRKWKLHTVAMPQAAGADPRLDAIRSRIRRETET